LHQVVAHALQIDRRHRAILLRERDIIDFQPVDAVGADDLDLAHLEPRAADRLRPFLLHLCRHPRRMGGKSGDREQAEADRPVGDPLKRRGPHRQRVDDRVEARGLDPPALARRPDRAARRGRWRA